MCLAIRRLAKSVGRDREFYSRTGRGRKQQGRNGDGRPMISRALAAPRHWIPRGSVFEQRVERRARDCWGGRQATGVIEETPRS